MATDYAIVATGGKQYRVEKGDSFVVDRLAEDEGAKVSLRAVMFRGESDVVLVPSELEKVKVEAKVAAHERGPKIKVATYKAKKGYRRTKGHRSELTRLEVTDVKLLSRRPAKAKAADAEEPAATTAADAPTKAQPKAAGNATTKAQPEAGDATSKAQPKAAAKPAAKAAASAASEAEGSEEAGAKPAEKAQTAKAKPATKPAAKRKTSSPKKET